MKRILYVHPYNNFTGSTKVLSDVIKSRHRDLTEVTVITETSQNGFLSNLGLKLINVPIIRWHNRAIPILTPLIWGMSGFLKTLKIINKFDAVYVNTILPGYAAIVARLYGKPVIYHVHEKYVDWNLKGWLGELIFRNIKSHRIFVSEYVKTQYPKKHNCKCEVVYNKLGEDFIKKVHIIPVEQHRRNQILMLATFQEGKGLNVLFEVARLLPEKKFTLVLSSSYDEIKRKLKLKAPQNISIYPKQSDIHPFYQNADIILNLSNPKYIIETFGLTILEGMAYGLPAIVPDKGGPKEVIENGMTGYSIDVTNPNEVAKHINLCLEEHEYARLFSNSLERVLKFQ